VVPGSPSRHWWPRRPGSPARPRGADSSVTGSGRSSS
jgi:hypothetical protein